MDYLKLVEQEMHACATSNLCRVEGEAMAWGVLWHKPVLIWGCKHSPKENTLLTASAGIFFFFATFIPLEALVMIIPWDHRTGMEGIGDCNCH